MEAISVAVRFRPPIGQDQQACGQCWEIEDNCISLHRSLSGQLAATSPSFVFDHVFDERSANAAVYDLLTRPIMDSAVQGFNGTVFAYGQTSSGKTFTMNGSEDEPGIIRLSIRDVFNLTKMITDREFLIRVSYMEIYNEDINDLLSLENQKLPVHESLERGVFVSGLREEIVNSAEQVIELIKLGEANRHFGETSMNARSSRSHTIFSMVIESSFKNPESSGDASNADAIRVSVLNLVDLAGSERIAKTGAEGVRLREGKHINKSLMVLGNVINKLSEGKLRGHIPYRDSKLTRILQPALGGNAKTSIICTVAPEEIHVEETRGTLQFASRAKRITNYAQVNEILTDAALLRRQKMEIEDLRRKLTGSHSEILEEVILKQRNDMLKSEMEHEKLKRELEEERTSREALERCISEQQKKIEHLSSLSVSSDSTQNTIPKNACSSRLSDEANEHLPYGVVLTTPTFKAVPNSFVVRRSNYCSSYECSPLPENFANFTDEDMWVQLNKGCTTDLDMLMMTPNANQPFFLQRRRPSGLSAAEVCEKERHDGLEACCEFCKPLIEDARKQCVVLRDENASLLHAISISKESADAIAAQKEDLLRNLAAEKQKLKDLEEEIRLFSISFVRRQGLLASLYTKAKAMVENLESYPVAASEHYECKS